VPIGTIETTVGELLNGREKGVFKEINNNGHLKG